MAARSAAPAKAASARIPTVGWDEARPAPVVLVSGPEDLLAERAMRAIREALTAADPSVEVSDLDASSAAPGDLTTLASPSLFGEPRLIRVTAVERLSDAFLAEALRYLAEPADDTTVVLRHGGGTRGKKLLDAIRGGLGGGVAGGRAPLKRDAGPASFAPAQVP